MYKKRRLVVTDVVFSSDEDDKWVAVRSARHCSPSVPAYVSVEYCPGEKQHIIDESKLRKFAVCKQQFTFIIVTITTIMTTITTTTITIAAAIVTHNAMISPCGVELKFETWREIISAACLFAYQKCYSDFELQGVSETVLKSKTYQTISSRLQVMYIRHLAKYMLNRILSNVLNIG